MPLKKIEKTGFIYIVYCRSGIEDYLELKYVLKNSQIDPEQRDIVVDVTRNALLNENEIGLLANTVNSLRGTKRFRASYPEKQSARNSPRPTSSNQATWRPTTLMKPFLKI